MHRWSEQDDLAALYVYLHDVNNLSWSMEEIASQLGIGFKSFKMRLRNFRAIEGRGGLGNYAQQSHRIYERYKNTTEPELRKVAFPDQK